MQMYHSDFKYIVRYLSCKNDKEKLESFFRTTDFKLDHPEAFLDWLAAVANDDRYIKAKQLIDKQNEKGGHINMCVLLDMYEERGEARGILLLVRNAALPLVKNAVLPSAKNVASPT
ncbi:MAG: hypothetical protein ACLTJ5_04840 [Clostridium sp.]